MKEVLSKIKTFINNLTAKIGDKKMHFICSFIITFVIGLIFGVFPGILVGCLVSLAKEVDDEFRFRKESEVAQGSISASPKNCSHFSARSSMMSWAPEDR